MATAIPVSMPLEEPTNSGPKRSQPLQHSQLAKLFRAHIRPKSEPVVQQTDTDHDSKDAIRHSPRPMNCANPNSVPTQASPAGPALAFPFFRPDREHPNNFQRPYFDPTQEPHFQMNIPNFQQAPQVTPTPTQAEPRNTKKNPLPVTAKSETVEQKTHLTKSALKDGLKWRKYGQKALKNSPYPRTYYRCTTPECGAKKQIEKYIDATTGSEMYKTVYVGEHIHLNPVFLQTKVEVQENFQSSVLSQTGKTGGDNILEIECAESVDCNNDGFSWRKYGQKKVKGGPHQRAYYKCAISECEVKKTIEQTESGTRLCTYNGNHTHTADLDGTNDSDRQTKKQKVVNSSPSQNLHSPRNTNLQGTPTPSHPRIKEEHPASYYPTVFHPNFSHQTQQPTGVAFFF